MTGWDDNAGSETRPIGDVLDGLGIRATVNEGELVAGALVLLKVIDEDGDTRLSLAHSDGLGWIERAGMLRVAETLETTSTLGLAGD
ncbi:hypothetical protein KQY30_20085 [Streptomyces sp. GMY02]|uniref:hypothetical protein n=1 Tax=Streptomyces sp. GMY02 TaxID=1333528 RepID=UPI001C2BB3D1|nr:hypothetical protein [Streptomyces sp. GMY02]QXE36199.1 hypothetical protein KQY30_20085 [Streptomyces sp. GMY02]